MLSSQSSGNKKLAIGLQISFLSCLLSAKLSLSSILSVGKLKDNFFVSLPSLISCSLILEYPEICSQNSLTPSFVIDLHSLTWRILRVVLQFKPTKERISSSTSYKNDKSRSSMLLHAFIMLNI